MIRVATVNTKPVANKPVVANSSVANKRTGDRHKDKAARRVYMAAYMRKKRAAGSAVGPHRGAFVESPNDINGLSG